MNLVTLDFHNTLFVCDRWFRLEIETLPLVVLERLEQSGHISLSDHAAQSASTTYRAIRKQATETGIECDAEASMLRVLESLKIELDPITVHTTVEQVMWEAVDGAAPRDGAVELVRSLARENVALAVVSSAAYHAFLEWCLERYGIRAAFAHVVTSASCGIYKSNPEIYRYTVDLVGTQPERAVHIGDSHRFDVASASKIGMRTILLADEHADLDPTPDAVICSLGEARPHLDRLLANDASVST
jgi:HAD superfamily hydrolase (TIGR01509 family)